LADYHDGAYEKDFVSPYTASAGNVDATVMILLQDWSSDESLRGHFDPETALLGLTPSLPTNRNLSRLLQEHFGLTLDHTYATNLFPFIKPGALNAPIPARAVMRAAREFAIPQMEIVRPRLLICLGLLTGNAIRRALGIEPARRLDAAIADPFSYRDTRVWCQAHTGGLGQNLRGRARVAQDWEAMRLDAFGASSEFGMTTPG
jgi:uracil-DNA glycosylase